MTGTTAEIAGAVTIDRADGTQPLITREELPPLRHYIGGSFDVDDSASTWAVFNPATGEQIADVPEGTAATVAAAVASAKGALQQWRRTTPRHRAQVLLGIADALEESTDLLRRVEAFNTGKPADVQLDDVESAIDVFRFAAGAARSFSEAGAAEYVDGHTSVIVREPVGVVGAIVPWNYPLLMAAWKIAPVLAAGNTLVIKPSEQTPLSLLTLVELTGHLLPAGVLNVVLGRGHVVGAELSSHPDVDLVALTGSVGSGRAVAASAAETTKRVHLELGGKAPVVVLADADLDQVADGVRNAAFWNAGQECGAGTRVLVHESVAERLTDLLVERVASFVVGDPAAGDHVEMGPLISSEHRDRVTTFLTTAIEEGATPLVGGAAVDGPGYFVAPTVLTDVKRGSTAAREEIFGPVVTIETFREVDEAIERANEVPYGLAASIWTTDARSSIELPRQLDFGTVWVNTHLEIATETPWGGFKGSGYGRDLSSYALEDFSRTKHVHINHAG